MGPVIPNPLFPIRNCLLLLAFALAGPQVFSVPSVVQASLFGIRPGATPVPRTAVQKAAIYLRVHPGTTLTFAEGDYHFSPAQATRTDLFLSNSDNANPHHVAILLEDVRRARLVGKGARLLCHGAILPIALRRCQDVEVTGFQVDWPRPLFSQGTVVAADAAGVTVTVDTASYPYQVKQGQLLFLDEGAPAPVDYVMEFDPARGGVASNTGDAGCLGEEWEGYVACEPGPGSVRLEHAFKRLPKVGNALVFWHSPRSASGMFLEDCREVRLSGLVFHHTAGLGVLAQYCENLTYRDVQFRPTDGTGRLFSGHDDGFHFSNCKGSIRVEACSFEGLMDDPINVHGTSVKVIHRLPGNRLLCRFMHEQSVGLKFGDPGDEVSFLDHKTLLSRGTGRIQAVRRISLTDFDLELVEEAPVSLAEGDAMENLTWTPEVAIRACRFGPVRARGLLLTTPRKAVVEDCVFRSSGSAILISGDANGWYESGAVKDVLIRHNRFENCLTSTYEFCNAVISVDPVIPTPGAPPFHRGIRIEDNVFVTFDNPILWARSAGGLSFTGNTVQASTAYLKWHPNRDGLTFLNCSDVRVENNHLDPAFTGRRVHIEGGDPASIHISGW